MSSLWIETTKEDLKTEVLNVRLLLQQVGFMVF